MADEQKTYLINIKDNLDEYAKRAADAKKEVKRLSDENDKLKKSETATTAEKEKGIAALKAAQAQYRSAQTSLQNATKAQNDNKNSYNQLYKQWVEAKKQLNDMPGAYERAADGTIQLSQAYIDASKDVADAKKAVDDFNLGVNSGATNIGNYASALDGLPGPLGNTVSGIKRVGLALKALSTNTVVLIIAGIVAALTALVKAFKSTDDGATKFNAILEQIKATMDVLRNVAIDVGQTLINVFKGKTTIKEAAAEIKESFTGIREEIQNATVAANEYANALDNLENSENNWISRQAELRNAQEKARFSSEDRTLSVEERRKYLNEYISLLLEEVEQNKKYAKERLDIEAQKLADLGGVTREQLLQYVTMSDEQRANAGDTINELRNRYEQQVNDLEQYYADYINADTEFFQKAKETQAKRFEFTNQERAELEAMKTANKEYYEAVLETINADLLRLSNTEEVNANAIRINQEFTDATKQQIQERAEASQWEAEQYALSQRIKLEAGSSILGSLSRLLGEQTKAGKAAAVAQATIDTYLSAQQAFTSMSGIPVVGPGLGAIAAAAAIAAGLANVKSILAVNPNSGNTLGTQVQSIVQTRYLAAPVNVNTADNTVSGLAQSAEYRKDMIAALSSMKTVVTVEDINAKTAEYNKVLVGAKI